MKNKKYQKEVQAYFSGAKLPKGQSIFMPTMHSTLTAMCRIQQLETEKPIADHSEVPSCKDSGCIKFDLSPRVKSPEEPDFPLVVIPTEFPTMTLPGYFIPEAMGMVPKGHTKKMLASLRASLK